MTSRILTFYSWKGGVGRSMALANVGVQLARKGKRVLMVDWDLEAPGLDLYFPQDHQVGSFLISRTMPSDDSGLLGLLCDATTGSQQSILLDAWKYRLSNVTLSPAQEAYQADQPPPPVTLDLLGSGRFSANYSSRLGDFSWASFFSEHNGGIWLEKLRDQWKKVYDFVLIDSRTGLTDAGGVCTVQMPDMLVLVFTANTQSLDGGTKFLCGVEKARQDLAYERTPLTVFPLLARWEGDKEVDLSEQWLERIENSISPIVETWCPINLPIRRLLERLRVPHVARFSFGEPLPVLSHSLTDPELPGLAYDLLANLISGPLSDAGIIIDPEYRTSVDLFSENQLDQFVKDEDLRQNEIIKLNKSHGSNSLELNKFFHRIAARALHLEELRLANGFAKNAVEVAGLRASINDNQDQDQIILIDSLCLLAAINQKQGSQTSALESYQNALNLLIRLQERNPVHHEWGTKIGAVEEGIGDIQRSMGELEAALHSYREAIASRDFLRSKWSACLGDQGLTIVKEKVGDVLVDLNDLSGAITIYRECLAEMEDSQNHSVVTFTEKDHGRLYEKIGKILIILKDPIGALASYQEALSMKVNTTEEETSYLGRADLNEVYKQIGDLSADDGQLSNALSAYGKALLINASLAEEDPTNATKQRDFNIVKDKYEALLGQHIHCIAYDVPLEYRAQAPGRCQRQFIKKPKDAPPGWRSPMEEWLDQWVERVDRQSPFTSAGLRIVEVQIDWRLISNSGLDEGVIRPVTGAGGWPLIPGSSIKGLFRRACRKVTPDRLIHWCGGEIATGDDVKLIPGLLRFHGAWPADAQWTANLLDVAHPQQEWQVGIPARKGGGAFGIVSLYKPKLQIGLSSASSLAEKDWQEIEGILRTGLDMGIGGRTCVGYGSSGRMKGDLVFQCALEGQGPAAKLLDGAPEFRPTMFRAAIRGMALRLFGGVTDPRTARLVVGRLFGSISPDDDKSVNVGLLATAYTDATCELGSSGWPNYRQFTYATTGRLQWRQMRPYAKGEEEPLVAELLRALHGLTMSLGGFGRGWRRPDHRIFWPGYDKMPIGCHWQWRDVASLPPSIHIQSPKALAKLLRQSRRLACEWLKATEQPIGGPSPWREVIHPQQMRIWTRRATDPSDAAAVAWFHNSPEDRQASGEQNDPRDLKRTILAGQMNQVGLIWNRLLPLLEPGGPAQTSAPAKPANPLARPAPAVMARPLARSAAVGARSAAARQPARAPQGSVSIAAHQGAYLESLVLHSLPADASPEARRLHTTFVAEMNRGAGANFTPLEWSD